MSKHEFVPKEQIAKYANLLMDRVNFLLDKIGKLGLVYHAKGAYVGYTLNYAGYDCLSINAFSSPASFARTQNLKMLSITVLEKLGAQFFNVMSSR